MRGGVLGARGDRPWPQGEGAAGSVPCSGRRAPQDDGLCRPTAATHRLAGGTAPAAPRPSVGCTGLSCLVGIRGHHGVTLSPPRHEALRRRWQQRRLAMAGEEQGGTKHCGRDPQQARHLGAAAEEL